MPRVAVLQMKKMIWIVKRTAASQRYRLGRATTTRSMTEWDPIAPGPEVVTVEYVGEDNLAAFGGRGDEWGVRGEGEG